MKKSSKKRGTNRKFFNILSILLILTALLSIGLIIYFDILPIEYLSIFIVVTNCQALESFTIFSKLYPRKITITKSIIKGIKFKGFSWYI